jgi:hypothetical protein
MMGEIFRKLRPFQPVENYCYIGMGSLWFSDFVLFHRTLGIRNMISIEREVSAAERFKANKPFRSIRLDFRQTSLVLPGLAWNKPHFLWLDYDDPINMDILLDMQTVTARAQSGTVLAVTVQCHHAPDATAAAGDTTGPTAIERFRDRFGRERVPDEVFEDDLHGWPFAGLSRRMLLTEIEAAISTRNAAGGSDVMAFRPICEIEYMDGVRMATVIGIFVAPGDEHKFVACEFGRLDFIEKPGATVRIAVPVLTMREIRQLERRLPRMTEGALKVGSIPPGHARQFARMYRYFPNFAVIED